MEKININEKRLAVGLIVGIIVSLSFLALFDNFIVIEKTILQEKEECVKDGGELWASTQSSGRLYVECEMPEKDLWDRTY